MGEAPSQSAPSVACSICGDALKPTDRFCGSCGALVNACRSCGQRLVAGDRFCPSCGMTADPAMVTARISGGGPEGSAHSPWASIFDKLQTATLGEFQVIRELGRGGMAAVYLAHDIHLDRKVAIKVMSPLLASDDHMVERFRREAKTGAGLKHPNIGTVHRVLEGEGLYFFVMDFIRGRPLDAIIHRNGVLTVAVTRALLYQIGSGLAYAHRRRIYHRDVKPGNVLVSAADGTAVVTDFGIAKVAEATTHTQTGAIVGTPAYMAPEQILAKEITGAVDQYALGAMAYEMLTGAPPFVGTSFVVMHAHTEIPPRPIRDSRPDCPPELDEAIMRMLAKHPDQRWPSLPHALAAMGASMVGEDDPIREELIRLSTPDEAETARYATNTPLSPPPPTVTRAAFVAMVAISPPPERIEVGDSFRLAASPRDQQGTEVSGVPVEWATNNESVLQVATDGTVTAIAPGAVEISATAGRARGAVLVNVEPGRVSSLQLSIPPGVLMAGDRIQLGARVMDKYQRQLPYAVRWGVADPNVARISPEGVLEARAAGSVEIFVESNGVRSAARVQIAPPSVSALQLTCDPQRPVVGDRIRVTAMPVDAHGRPMRERAMGWSLSDLTLVTILADGVYEARSPGTLRVTAASEGQTATIDIVIASAPVAGVNVSPAPHYVVPGQLFRLSAAVVDAKGNVLSDKRIAWACSDSSLATVSDDGTVMALGVGDVRILASCEGKAASAAVSIRSAPVAAVRIMGVPSAVYVKAPFRLTAIALDASGHELAKSAEWRSSNSTVLNVNQSGQATGLAVGGARVTAIIEGVEGTVDVYVAEAPLGMSVPSSASVTAPPMPQQRAADMSASAIFSPQAHPPVQPPPSPRKSKGERSSTPVVAPVVQPPPQPAPRGGRRGLLIGAGIGVVAVIAAVMMMSKSGSDTPQVQRKPTTSSAPVVPDSTASVVKPSGGTAVVEAPPPSTTNVPVVPAPKAPAATRPNAKTATSSVPDRPVDRPAPQRTPAAAVAPDPTPARERDAFRISVSAPPSLRVGDGATLRATVERTAGTGATPSVTWESSRPGVLRIDPTTGTATAVGEGQVVVSAIAGGTRADVPMNVVPAPVAYPAATPTRTEAPARPAGASPEEIRSRGEAALRDAPNAMVSALRAKNTALAGQLFGDQSGDAGDLLKNLKDYVSVTATVTRTGTAQMTERAGTIEYQVDFRYTNQMGLARQRALTIRAEVERSGDTWAVVRHRLVSGGR